MEMALRTVDVAQCGNAVFGYEWDDATNRLTRFFVSGGNGWPCRVRIEQEVNVVVSSIFAADQEFSYSLPVGVFAMRSKVVKGETVYYPDAVIGVEWSRKWR